jgi:hypothetical protein
MAPTSPKRERAQAIRERLSTEQAAGEWVVMEVRLTLQEWTQISSAVHEQMITVTRAQECMVRLLKYFVCKEIGLVYLYRVYRRAQDLTCKIYIL